MGLVWKQLILKNRSICPLISSAYASTSTPKERPHQAPAATTLISLNGDLVGQPNPVSNLRPIIFNIPKDETAREKLFRLKREKVQRWNEEFWAAHNTKFIRERKEFIMKLQSNKSTNDGISADEMSIFYKKFLDKYWQIHMWYNYEWYKSNAELVLLAFQVKFDRLKRRFTSTM